MTLTGVPAAIRQPVSSICRITTLLHCPLKREDVKRKLIAHKNCIHEIGQDKGLLSLMLSLPEEWDYTTKGLARICKDGVDSICAGVRELEEHGYVIRQRVRNPNGQLGAIEYTILEQPRPPEPKPEKSERENPVLDNPEQASPVLEEPEQGNPAQLNTNRSSKEKSKKDLSSTEGSNPVLQSCLAAP